MLLDGIELDSALFIVILFMWFMFFLPLNDLVHKAAWH